MAGCGQQSWNVVIDLVGGKHLHLIHWTHTRTLSRAAACLAVILMSSWRRRGPLAPSHYCTESGLAMTNTFGVLCFKGRASVYAKHTAAYQGIRPRCVLSFIGSPVECACVTFPAVCSYPSDSGVCVCV